MHPRSFILAALLCALGTGALGTGAQAAGHPHCKPSRDGGCAPPPAPPSPPAPPGPGAAMTDAPPPLPPRPEVPAEAHAACAGKRPGSVVAVTLNTNESMSGVCRRVAGHMVFRMRSYHRQG